MLSHGNFLIIVIPPATAAPVPAVPGRGAAVPPSLAAELVPPPSAGVHVHVVVRVAHLNAILF